MMKRYITTMAGTLLLGLQSVAAQGLPPVADSPLAAGYLERAREMMTQGNYAGVIDQLDMIRTQNVNLPDNSEEELLYMMARALYERGSDSCVALLEEFDRNYPASPDALAARLYIGDYYFFAHKWDEALRAYRRVDTARLNSDMRPLYTYRRALCLIKTGMYGEARELISAIAGLPRYRNAAAFYDAYLDYIAGDYSKAYSGFQRVEPGVEGLEAGYYMTQIEYAQGKYDQVIDHGRSLLRKHPIPELVPEIDRIVGLSYFKRNELAVARQFLEAYMNLAGSDAAADAVYALGVCEYDDDNTDRAAELMSQLTDMNNDIAQSAWLYLGQCELRKGNTDAATVSFEKASRMTFDREVSETALYNYVATVLDGGTAPFASGIDMMEKFLTVYPHSQYAPQVERTLASAYYNDKNYAKALKSINAISRPNAEVLAAKQKILYQLGIETLANGKAREAADYLRQSVDLSKYNKELANESYLWLGDAQYAQGQYKEALKSYNAFVRSAAKGSNRTLGLYDLAYARYMTGAYGEAAKEFRTALTATPALPEVLASDARLRLADCLYYSGSYKEAADIYDSVARTGGAENDYAAYRHAVMKGLAGDVNAKIKLLEEFGRLYPDSRWRPDAMLEKALTYQSLNRMREAQKAFLEVGESYPESAQARKAMLNLALQQSKGGQSEESAQTYRTIISRWPSSEEAQIANDDLRKYYAATGNLSEYALFLKSVPGARQLAGEEMERLSFDAAETAYADDPSNLRLLEQYVSEYPDGSGLAAALLDLANGYRGLKNHERALACLETLIAKRRHSAQYPEALLLKAEILENDRPGSSHEAFEAYAQLERDGGQTFMTDALTGMARTADDPATRARYANKARLNGGLPADEVAEMMLIEADSHIRGGNAETGIELYETLSRQPASQAGAKAAVELAQYHINHHVYDAAERVLTEFTESGTPHQYWLARGFIALADTYYAQGKKSLAREYLQSLRSNYPGRESDITSMINTRLKTWK